jgi:hypothetical protein
MYAPKSSSDDVSAAVISRFRHIDILTGNVSRMMQATLATGPALWQRKHQGPAPSRDFVLQGKKSPFDISYGIHLYYQTREE